jgi:hypothetical protein
LVRATTLLELGINGVLRDAKLFSCLFARPSKSNARCQFGQGLEQFVLSGGRF